MDGKRKALACVLAGAGTGVLMLLLLYTACPLLDTDMYTLFFQGTERDASGRTASLFILFFLPLIPPTVSTLGLIRKDEAIDVLMNTLLSGIIAFIIQVLYVLLRLQ